MVEEETLDHGGVADIEGRPIQCFRERRIVGRQKCDVLSAGQLLEEGWEAGDVACQIAQLR